jgi:hypothetical protein
MPTTTERLAGIAHDLWREDLERRGWRPGRYDPGAKTHDALVPFDCLGKHDRRQALLGIQALELEQELIDSIWYERGPARCFTAEEMCEGFPVTTNPEGIARETHPSADRPAETGEVIGWEIDDEGWLCAVAVRWSDGSISEHHPAARELRRCGEDAGSGSSSPPA